MVDVLESPCLYQLQREAELRVDRPHEQQSLIAQRRDRKLRDLFVQQRIVRDGHAARRVHARQLPRRVYHDNVEQATGELLVPLCKPLEVERHYIDADGNAVNRHDKFLLLGLIKRHLALGIVFFLVFYFHEESFFYLILRSLVIDVLLDYDLLSHDREFLL